MHHLGILLSFSFLLLNACKQKQSEQSVQAITIKKDSTIFEKYDSWLSELKLPKNKKLYLDILKQIHSNLPQDSCKEVLLEGLNDKVQFQNIINEFKTLPYQDKYIFIRGLNTWTSLSVGTIYTLIDKNDSIISFKYDCIVDGTYTGGGYLDSIYLSDWNKNGSNDLIIKDFSRFSGFKNYDKYIYDLKISNNQFNLLFIFTDSGYSKVGMDRIHREWKDTVRFLNPSLIEKTSLSWFIVDSIKREDYDSDEQYKTKLNAQKAYLDEMAKRSILLKKTVKSLYQDDKKSKTFKKKGR